MRTAEYAPGLAHWQTGALGRAVALAEAQLLATAMDDVFGLELLHLGVWGTGWCWSGTKSAPCTATCTSCGPSRAPGPASRACCAAGSSILCPRALTCSRRASASTP